MESHASSPNLRSRLHIKPLSRVTKHSNRHRASRESKRPFAAKRFVFFQRYQRSLSLFGGLSIVALWTYLRHISNGVNFDVVGQVGLAQQWSQGLTGGAEVGATNYLIKMPVYAAVNAAHILSPMNRLLLLAMLFNLFTFFLIFKIGEKILNLYQVTGRTWFYLGILWLATISGSVFWMDYANSRNLETAGGLAIIYFALKFIRERTWHTWLIIVLLGSITFFADPLQLYVGGLGIFLLSWAKCACQRTADTLKTSLGLSLALGVAYAGALTLAYAAKRLLQITILTAPREPLSSLAPHAPSILHGLIATTAKVFGADFWAPPYGANTLREVLNAVIIIGLIGALVHLRIKKSRTVLYSLIGILICVNYLLYAVSGQVLQWETSRYLVMVPILVLLASAALTEQASLYRQRFQNLWVVIIVTNSILLLGAVAVALPVRHARDAHITTTINFLRQHNFPTALSTREIGITATYFSQGNNTVLPMACTFDHQMQPTNLFYDKSAFDVQYSDKQEIPVIVPDGGLLYGHNNCGEQDIIRQLGRPVHRLPIPSIGTALVYHVQQLAPAGIGGPNEQARKLYGHKNITVAPRQALHLAPLHGGCNKNVTDIVVAHPDDDLLFINPALAQQLHKGCVRTVFVTAADGGRPEEYWRSREQGLEAAYASMLGANDQWVYATTVLQHHTFVQATLRDNPRVGLIFLRLPDGNVNGRGFPVTGNTSLESLTAGKIESIKTVDGIGQYTYPQLIKLLSFVIATDKPLQILTLVSDGSQSVGDHSDHRAVGTLTLLARDVAESPAVVRQYLGYPAGHMTPNLSKEDIANKTHAFYTYAYEDAAICSRQQCHIEGTYHEYFSRSYHVDRSSGYKQTSSNNTEVPNTDRFPLPQHP